MNGRLYVTMRTLPRTSKEMKTIPFVIYLGNCVVIFCQKGFQLCNSFNLVVLMSPGPDYMAHKTHLFAEMSTVLESRVRKTGGGVF